MKKNNKKKGFTIVELVIVIAVIAILAGVLIPTFSGVITKANKSAVLQEARNVYTEVYANDIADGKINGAETAVTGQAAPSPYTGTYAYETGNNAVESFSYTKDGITVTLTPSTGAWN